jgi:hypothetical protein
LDVFGRQPGTMLIRIPLSLKNVPAVNSVRCPLFKRQARTWVIHTAGKWGRPPRRNSRVPPAEYPRAAPSEEKREWLRARQKPGWGAVGGASSAPFGKAPGSYWSAFGGAGGGGGSAAAG